MSAAGDTVVSGAGATIDLASGGAGAARGLLLVVEPGGAETQTGTALLAEGKRLAARLDVQAKALTWSVDGSDPVVDMETVAELLAAQVEAAGSASVLLADSDLARALAPVVAHRLGCGAVLGCGDVLADSAAVPVFVKPVYGGWLEQEVRAAGTTTLVATLDLSGIEVPPIGDGQAPIVETLTATGTESGAAAKVRRLELLPPDAKSVDLVHARRIVSAGMGAAGDEALAAVHELADLLEGSVGATRPVVDEGRLPKERLIGQTGRAVTPDLYVALGISGSPHHVAGVRKADTILAVNRDPRAPIFQFADVGYVADLQAVLPALVARIKEWRDAGE